MPWLRQLDRRRCPWKGWAMPTSKLDMTLTREQDLDLGVEDEAAGLALEHRLHPSPPQRAETQDPKVLDEAFAVDWAFEEV
jgi:hypothetical protein